MHSIVARLVLWVAEILDRNLVTVPDLDDDTSHRHQLISTPKYFTTTEGQAHDR
jgi:hypothetical protein